MPVTVACCWKYEELHCIDVVSSVILSVQLVVVELLFVPCVMQDLQKQKEVKEEELLGLQKVVNDKKSKVRIHVSFIQGRYTHSYTSFLSMLCCLAP